MSLATVSTSSSAADQGAAGTWQVPRFVRRLIVPVSLLVIWQVLASYGIINRRFSSSPVDILVALWKLAVNGQLFDSLWISWCAPFSALRWAARSACWRALSLGCPGLARMRWIPPFRLYARCPFWGWCPCSSCGSGWGKRRAYCWWRSAPSFRSISTSSREYAASRKRLIELGRSYGLNRWELIRDIILPAALPNALVGLRYSLGIAWLVLVIAEQINATSGLGWLIIKASELAQTSVIMMVLAVYALIGILADAIVRLIETRALRWQRSFQGA